MNLDLALKGSLAKLPDAGFDDAALLRELVAHGMSESDSRLALAKALLDDYVVRTGACTLAKRPRAFEPRDSGRP